MQTCMIVKIKTGPRTKPTVEVQHMSQNEHTLVFRNGKKLSEYDVGEWVATQLTKALRQVGEA